jgi:pimeloyl-ACP methyl ester carboxylesterase
MRVSGWWLAITLLACGGDDVEGARARTDYVAAAAGDFYAAPFPDLGRTVGDVASLPAPRETDILVSLKAIAGEADGFGATSTIYFAFEAPLAPLAIEPNDSVARDDVGALASPVVLIDLDATPPRALPIEVRYRDDGGPFGAPNLLSILPLQGVPMTPGHRHAAVITREVRDAMDVRVGISDAVRALRRGDAPAGLDTAIADEQRRALGELEALGLEVAAFALFSPADAAAPMRALRDAIVEERPELTRDFAIIETHDDFCVFASELPMPVYQRGEPPFAREGGDIAFDDAGAPILARTEIARVFVTLPRAPMPSAGFPTVVFSRTGGGGDRPLIDRGVRDASGMAIEPGSGPARDFARVGFAGVSVDGPHGGARNVSGEDEQFLVFNVANPRALRDNVRQSAAELALVAHLLGEWRFDASGCEGLAIDEARLDDTKLALMGHSMGATIAPLTAAFEPRYRALLLSGAGGSWIQNVVHKEKPVVVRPFAEVLLRTPTSYALHEHDPALMLLQWAGEGADPPVFGEAIRARGTHVLMMQGIVDHYILPPIANATSLALALDLAGGSLDADDPELDRFTPLAELLPLVEGTTRDLPASANGDDGRVTRIVTQHAEDGVEDGHEVVFQLDAPKAEYRCFLASLARGEVPTVSRDCE